MTPANQCTKYEWVVVIYTDENYQAVLERRYPKCDPLPIFEQVDLALCAGVEEFLRSNIFTPEWPAEGRMIYAGVQDTRGYLHKGHVRAKQKSDGTWDLRTGWTRLYCDRLLGGAV